MRQSSREFNHASSTFRSFLARTRVLIHSVGIILLLAVVMGGLYWGWQKLSKAQAFAFKTVRVDTQAAQHLKAAAIAEVVAANLVGGFFSLDTNLLRAKLHENPWVAQVRLRRIWPNVLRVVVSEKKPLARWGEDALLDSDGELFSPPRQEIPAALPRLNGPSGEQQTVLTAFRRLSALLANSELQITELSLSVRNTWQVTVNERFFLLLGAGDLVRKSKNFLALMPVLTRNYPEAKLQIDLRYPNGAAVRRRV